MSRMNNTSRSLRIISKQNGWDPDQIVDGPNLGEILHERRTPHSSDTWPIPGAASSPQGDGRTPVGGEGHSPAVDDRDPPQRTSNADPYPGMPGAR